MSEPVDDGALFDLPSDAARVVPVLSREADIRVAARDSATTERFRSHIVLGDPDECWWWTGAVASFGHGRFWIRDGLVVIAHRFAWAIAHPDDEMPELLAHECDNPLCQNDQHLHPADRGQNRREWAARRHTIGGPLRDMRGARARSVAVREALLSGVDPAQAMRAGMRPVDAGQGTLWDDLEQG